MHGASRSSNSPDRPILDAKRSLSSGDEIPAKVILPPEGSLEREQMEQMVDFYFARLTIAADNALGSGLAAQHASGPRSSLPEGDVELHE